MGRGVERLAKYYKGIGSGCFCEKDMLEYFLTERFDAVYLELGTNIATRPLFAIEERVGPLIDAFCTRFSDKKVFLMSPIKGFSDVSSTAKDYSVKFANTRKVISGHAAKHANAVLHVWYPGERGGEAVARILRGKAEPGGKLPITFYRSCDDLPAFTDYSMQNRTYTNYVGEPLYAFGHGLGYTKFRICSAEIKKHGVRVVLENVGDRNGETVLQIYRKIEHPLAERNRRLVGVLRVSLRKGERKSFKIPFAPFWRTLVDEDGRRFAYDGLVALTVTDGGTCAPIVLSDQALK